MLKTSANKNTRTLTHFSTNKLFLYVFVIGIGFYHASVSYYIRLRSFSLREIIYASLLIFPVILIVSYSFLQKYERSSVDSHRNTKTPKFIYIWVALSLVYQLPILFRSQIDWGSSLGDFAIFVFPAIILLLGIKSQGAIYTKKLLIALGVVLFIASLLSFFSPFKTIYGRYEPTHILLIAMLLIFSVRATSPQKKTLFFLILLLVSYLTAFSHQRTNILLILLGGVLTLLFAKTNKYIMFLLFLVIPFLLVSYIFVSNNSNTLPKIPEISQLYVTSTRFSKLSEGDDESLGNRLLEAQDVLRVINNEWIFYDYILGFGHGATYSSYGGYYNTANLNPDGSIHNIHFTPIMILYRYGLVGMIFGFIVIVAVLQDIYKFIGTKGKYIQTEFAVFILAMTFTLLSSLLRNIFQDPLISYTVAGYFFFKMKQNSAEEITV